MTKCLSFACREDTFSNCTPSWEKNCCINLVVQFSRPALYICLMDGNHNSRIARLERIRVFHKAAAENLQAVLDSPLETPESRQRARRELLRVLETLNAAERELAELKAKR